MNHITKDELKALLHEIPVERQRLMVLVTFLHGLRVSETINLTGASIRDGYLTIQRLKGSLKTTQPFVHSDDPELDEFHALTMLAQTTLPKQKLFPMSRFGVYKLIRRAGMKAGIPIHKLHPHALKHGCAMAIIQAGIEYTRQYLGHRTISSTGEYLRVSDESASRKVAGLLG
jgi:integrase